MSSVNLLFISNVYSTDKKRLYSAPPKPVTVMDALEQRLEKYKATADAAKAAADSSKQRRMARVAKVRCYFDNLVFSFNFSEQTPMLISHQYPPI